MLRLNNDPNPNRESHTLSKPNGPFLNVMVVATDSDATDQLLDAFNDSSSLNVSHVAQGGREALAHLRREFEAERLPHLVLIDLDLNIENKHAFELLSDIKDDPKLRAIPVVVMAQDPDAADVLEAYSGGVCSFVGKPQTVGWMTQMVEEFVSYWTLVTAVPRRQARSTQQIGQLRTTLATPSFPNGVEPIEILIVDDSVPDTNLLEIAFEELNLVKVLHVARDGEQGLAYLRREGEFQNGTRPHLVLLDINMPKKDGFEMLAELKADPTLRSIPVVMLTTSSQDDDIEKSYRTGACSFITKPQSFLELSDMAGHFAFYWSMITKLPYVALP